MQASPQSLSLAVVWLFFIIMGPGMASPVYKLTFLGGNTRDINEGVNRIDRILEKKSVPEPPGMASPVYKLTFLGGNTRDIELTFLGGNTRDINEGVNRIDRILEKKPVPEPEHPKVPTAYDVEFRHVSFSYENTEQGTRTEALRDVSFIAPQGKITALVGPSGSGKSTVANLIPRFWDVEQGKICIGGADIRQIATAKLMDKAANQRLPT